MQLDLRIVAATNKDLPAMVNDGRFRENLYFRLAVIPIRLASPRERLEDMMPIAEHCLRETAARLGKSIAGSDETAVQWKERHTWPGNVRELENVVERVVVLARDARITRADSVPSSPWTRPASPSGRREARGASMCDVCSKKCAATRGRWRRSSAFRCGRSSEGFLAATA